MLKFNNAWRFDSPGAAPPGLVRDVADLIGRIAAQGNNRQRILEHFKSHFSRAAGSASSWSSNESWAETDLDREMGYAANNAPLFISAFYDGCEELRGSRPDLALPDLARINRTLYENGAGYEIRPPDLISLNPHVSISVPERVVSLTERAHETIRNSLLEADRLLAEGRARQAVQESLWLLETVSTAFKGLDTGAGTIQGKYFNKIAEDLRRQHKGKMLESVLQWMTTLHGFLSSPTGGGIRHGVDLKADIDIQPNEAQLFCDLIRSYVSFLMAEHQRLSAANG